MKNCFFNKINFFALFFILSPLNANSTTINFSGQFDVIQVDTGTGIYSGNPIGTNFSGFIDDVTFNGEISNGTGVTTPFSCCIAAGGLALTNNIELDNESVLLLNSVAGSSMFTVGDMIDLVDIEGDESTLGGGRIEVGLSYILDASAFNDENLDNYPFDHNDLQLALFFILEENGNGDAIYSALGQINAVPLPASVWLFGSGIALFVGLIKHKKS